VRLSWRLCPLVPAYTGKNGQARFVWVGFLTWYDQYGDVSNTHGRAVTDPDDLDWHCARTVSARAQAKRDILLTARLEGKYGDIKTMEQTGENAARQAVLTLLAIPSRIAPRLAALTDELEHFHDGCLESCGLIAA
jgi:phage terminase Nu1 subunit (DNA packaging protein)